MKKYQILSILFCVIFFAGLIFNSSRALRAENLDLSSVNEESISCQIVFPEAQSCSKKTGSPPYVKAYRTNSLGENVLSGLAYSVSDIVGEVYGYSGPIEMMMGINLDGTIASVHVVSHSETASYVTDENLDIFLKQFTGLDHNSSFELGENIDGITHATITSETILEAIVESIEKIRNKISTEKTALSPLSSSTQKKTPLTKF